VNGIHDLGGMHGFGPVQIEPDEPVFHHDWERRAFALTLAAGYLGRWNIDQSRHAREQMDPAAYLATTYYEHWLFGLERLLDETGMVTRAELEARIRGDGVAAERVPGARALLARDVDATLRNARASKADEDFPPRFAVGARVVTKNVHPVGHTRLPRYARERRGEIALDHGVWVFPDASAHGLGRQPQHCYSVRFAARELWGDAAPVGDAVHLDLWDDHLEPA
jgi:nitrile hydratase subunit beta